MYITEQELREWWQNGRGAIPPLPVGTRFSLAAQDFIKANRLEISFSHNSPVGQAARSPDESPKNAQGIPVPELHPRQKTIYTDQDIQELARQGITNLMMTPDVVLTEIARERAMQLGIRLIYAPGGPLSLPVSAPKTDTPEVLAPAVKLFVTERDVTEMAQRGVSRLKVNQNVVFTAAAQQRITLFGMQVERQENAAAVDEDLVRAVKKAVLARIGGQVDEAVLDAVIRKVLANS